MENSTTSRHAAGGNARSWAVTRNFARSRPTFEGRSATTPSRSPRERAAHWRIRNIRGEVRVLAIGGRAYHINHTAERDALENERRPAYRRCKAFRFYRKDTTTRSSPQLQPASESQILHRCTCQPGRN